ncbi:hypothetical protein LQF12_03085 [Ruania suaedae]|uniref:hypothetical protein n=1 Tax=Ruania suaedae TaxID=2897774 RepID=UPI001E411B5F|nr:hypothetical protein [Ruania suaedae]UFU03609.1 hypothetical protein LQF12_03085 [Ruania suaedae]
MRVRAQRESGAPARAAGRRGEDPGRVWWMRADHPLPLQLRRGQDGPVRIVAATPATVLTGFRDPAEVAQDLETLGVYGLADVISVLRRPDRGEALLYALGLIFATGRAAQISLARRVADAAPGCTGRPALTRLLGVARHHPDDPGLLVTTFLHEIRLSPGEVLDVGPGAVHGMLTGRALHIAALRGRPITVGLSLEPVPTQEVLQRLQPRVGPGRLVPGVGRGGVVRYPSLRGVSLTQVSGEADLEAGGEADVVALDGPGWVHTDERAVLRAGQVLAVPAGRLRLGTGGRIALVESCDEGAGDVLS